MRRIVNVIRNGLGPYLTAVARLSCAVGFLVGFSSAAEVGRLPESTQSSQPVRKQAAATSVTVNTLERQQVVDLFKKVYPASIGVPSGWNGDVANCIAGDTSQAYKDATMLRVNFFRAMAGLPGDIMFDQANNAKCQQAALMMSAKGDLSHFPGPDWPCYTVDGASAAAHSNLSNGAGATAIDNYMDDAGSANWSVRHRLGILVPPAKIMGSGSIPSGPRQRSANALWVDTSFGSFPTQLAWAAWPPQGYIPYEIMPLTSDRWSFSLFFKGGNGTNLTSIANASVSMQHHGTNVPLSYQFRESEPFGRSHIVWRPHIFLGNRSASDVTYSVTISNVVVSGVAQAFKYDVIVIEPFSYAPYTFNTLAGVPPGGDDRAIAARFYSPHGVTMDRAGNIYLAEQGNNTIRKITSSGVVSTIAGQAERRGSEDGVGKAARFNNPQGIAVDITGNLFVADTYNHTIRKISPVGVVSTLAGLAENSGTADGVGSEARFNYPHSVAVDSANNLYVADSLNHTIRKITANGVVSTWAGLAERWGEADGFAGAARFYSPHGLAIDSADNLYVCDTGNGTIRKITTGRMVSTLAGLAGLRSSTDGVGIAARFYDPEDICVDANGNIYVSQFDHIIRKILPNGMVSTLAGLAGRAGSTDGAGDAARFNYPSGMAVDAKGNLYVADSSNQTFRKISPSAEVSTLAGLAGNAGSADGTGSAPRLDTPHGVAVDSIGNLYLADTGNHMIRKITPNGVVSTLAGSLFSGDADGTKDAARFNYSQGIAVDRAGNIYVADTYNFTIRKITPSGVVTTLAGLAGSSGKADGSGSAARFKEPAAVAVDSADNVYVCDSANHTIRRITADGIVSTVAGLAGIPGAIDGRGNSARFNYPSGVAVDGNGNVYVADTENNTIRKITQDSAVTTLAGTAPGDDSGSIGSGDGTGRLVRFFKPHGVAVDGMGNVFVADTSNHMIRKITPEGLVSTLGGLAGSREFNDGTGTDSTVLSSGSTDGTGTYARFFFPRGVAVDSAGAVYVADTFNNAIRKGVPLTVSATLRLTIARTMSGEFKLQFPSSLASTYSLLRKTHLDDRDWTLLKTIPGNGATVEIIPPVEPNTTSFFRVRVE